MYPVGVAVIPQITSKLLPPPIFFFQTTVPFARTLNIRISRFSFGVRVVPARINPLSGVEAITLRVSDVPSVVYELTDFRSPSLFAPAKKEDLELNESERDPDMPIFSSGAIAIAYPQ